MILATLDQAMQYASCHPGLLQGFDFLRHESLPSLSDGKHEIDGERLYVMLNKGLGRGRSGAKLEAHCRYIDIQYTIDGDERIGWMPLARCLAPDGPFDETKDVVLFADRPTTWVAVPPGSFTIFFPHDAHAPLAGRGFQKKAVVKIAVDLDR